jgi:hypothetical protein
MTKAAPSRDAASITQGWTPDETVSREISIPVRRSRAEVSEYLQGLKRRREAALRLPPLMCGCRDPESNRHRFSCLGGN